MRAPILFALFALFSISWSCTADDSSTETIIAAAGDETCSCCGDPDPDPDPDCERSLCETGSPEYCTIAGGADGDACVAAVCADEPACCTTWWTQDCVALTRALCPAIECPTGVCGDGYADAGEACDDGNFDDGDGCSADCLVEAAPTCGDGSVDEGEACDAGDANGAYGSLCTTDCTVGGPLCGDGIVQAEEQCDPGAWTITGDAGIAIVAEAHAYAFDSADYEGQDASMPDAAPDAMAQDAGGMPDAAPDAMAQDAGGPPDAAPAPGDADADDEDEDPRDGPCALTCRWRGCGDLLCAADEETTCPSDCAGPDIGDDDLVACCDSPTDTCGQRGDGQCQSGCAWGADPDCVPLPPTDDATCCGDPSDPCSWNGDDICDEGCAWADVDCVVVIETGDLQHF